MPWDYFSCWCDLWLASVTDPQGHTVTYAYDNAGQRTQLTYPNGITM